MSKSTALFTIIDYVGRPFQNTVHYKHIIKKSDISYSERYSRCRMDLYFRQEDEKIVKPVILYFPGGGFMKGGKKFRSSICHILANEGFKVFAVDYRLAPEHPFPAPVEDVVVALNYLPVIADEYRLDLSNILLCGDSSGGYMACYGAAVSKHPELAKRLSFPECKVQISGLIGLCAVYDAVQMVSMFEPLGFARQTGEYFLGIELDRKFKNLQTYQYKDCISPMNFVNDDWCKTLVVYSKKDLFCKGQGEAMIEALQKHNIPHTEVHSNLLINNHCYMFNYWTIAGRRAMETIKEFLREFTNK